MSHGSLHDPAARSCFNPGEEPEEFEPYAAVNPEDPRHVVAAWMLGDDRARWIVQTAVSRDGGDTWSTSVTPRVSGCAGGMLEWITSFHDPWIAVGPDGRVYLSSLVARWNAEPRHQGVQVVTSPDGGTSWETPTVVAESETRTRGFDNTAVAADPAQPGVAYVTTTEYGLPAGAVQESQATGSFALARTTDGGHTWSNLAFVAETAPGRRVSAPQIVVDPRDSTAYGIYFEGDLEEKRNAVLNVVRSEDSGQTWSAPQKIADFVPMKGEARLPMTELRVQTADDIVSAIIDPRLGVLYVSFADARFTDGALLQVSLASSRDGGQTWSEPVRVSSEPSVMAWLPGVALGDDGSVSVAYHDLTDDVPRQFATVPTNVRRRQVRFDGEALVPGEDVTLDRFNLLGAVYVGNLLTSDYLSQVVTSRGFLTVYARSNCGPYSVDCVGFPGSGRSRNLMDVYAR